MMLVCIDGEFGCDFSLFYICQQLTPRSMDSSRRQYPNLCQQLPPPKGKVRIKQKYKKNYEIKLHLLLAIRKKNYAYDIFIHLYAKFIRICCIRSLCQINVVQCYYYVFDIALGVFDIEHYWPYFPYVHSVYL